MPPSLPAASPLAHHWTLDPGVVFLNHGSFGATPRDVLDEQARFRDELEREPVSFMVERLRGRLDDARRALAAFLACDWNDLALVTNATIGVATVLANLDLRPGDEILINDHEYPACQNACRALAARAGARVVRTSIPFPCPGPEAASSAILGSASDRTRLALISHVTSPTALVLPVEGLTRELESRGVRVLVDGAHAPGMLHGLDLSALGASYYTANCHKWICAPKGSAFLHVRRDLQRGFRPLALSNNAEKPIPGRDQFLTEFDFLGTSDQTAHLTIPRALSCVGAMVPGGWAEVASRNRALALRGRRILCDALGIEAPAPESMIGSIATLILPAHAPARHRALMARPTRYADALQDALLDRWRIQVPIWGLPERPDRFVRISAQLYNCEEQYEYLARALKEELSREAA